MSFKDEVTTYVHNTFTKVWTTRNGQKVPTADTTIGLGNDAVIIDAVVLYADLADSTGLVKNYGKEFAAEVYKNYVYGAVKSIQLHGGEVTAFDGDRVMGVFMGNRKRNDAVRAALRINGVVDMIIQPELKAQYTDSTFKVDHKVGVDCSEVWVANTGIRGNNDYVWVGTAANNAAKMASLGTQYSTYITYDVYSYLEDNLKKFDSGLPVFHTVNNHSLGYAVYGSNATIGP